MLPSPEVLSFMRLLPNGGSKKARRLDADQGIRYN
jgi:hypothetical protein